MTNNLKELTWEHHKSAERTEFTSVILSGEISPRLYYDYLCAQHECYSALEEAVTLPSEYETVFRAVAIMEDIDELASLHGLEPREQLNSVSEYIEHISNLAAAGDNDGLLAHLYVRHFGDMSGGQIIRTRVPGAGTMYDFDDIDSLKTGIRGLLTDEMAIEAGHCFQFVEQMFEELLSETDYYFNNEFAQANGTKFYDEEELMDE
jgi:heme oxygenase